MCLNLLDKNFPREDKNFDEIFSYILLCIKSIRKKKKRLFFITHKNASFDITPKSNTF